MIKHEDMDRVMEKLSQVGEGFATVGGLILRRNDKLSGRMNGEASLKNEKYMYETIDRPYCSVLMELAEIVDNADPHNQEGKTQSKIPKEMQELAVGK